jgi:predicted protein tyrosine phosphatase
MEQERNEQLMRVFVLNKQEFYKLMTDNGITDDNVELKDNVMFISIRGTSKIHGIEPSYFKRNHVNVITMTFDDIGNEVEGYLVFTKNMAKELFQFIKRNRNKKTCVVHCSAGISRSGAVGSFIQGYCGGDWELFKKDNPHILPNGRVLRMLNQEKYDDKE